MRGGLILNGDRVRVLTREASRELDRVCIEEYGIPGIVLMENAARAIEQVILDRYGDAGRAVVVCGPGNNGGDGFAVARLLVNRGWDVRVVMTRTVEAYTGDAGINARVCAKMGMQMHRWDAADVLAVRAREVVIDALLGTGVARAVAGAVGECIEWINGSGASVLAVDVPSGMDCDSGMPAGGGACVRAGVTVTLAGMKAGLLNACAWGYAGEVVVGDIGAPRAVLSRLGGAMVI